jgi:hypothetical protein
MKPRGVFDEVEFQSILQPQTRIQLSTASNTFNNLIILIAYYEKGKGKGIQ